MTARPRALLAGLSELLRAAAATAALIDTTGAPRLVNVVAEVDATLTRFGDLEGRLAPLQPGDPMTAPLLNRLTGRAVASVRRRGIIGRDAWRKALFHADHLTPLGLDDAVAGAVCLAAEGCGRWLGVVTLFRARGAKPFARRHAALVRQVIAAVGDVAFRPMLVPPADPLAVLNAGQRQTLDALVSTGDSEKQIAHRLGRSPHTVHAHVKQIYRAFNVGSRSELLAALLRRDGAPP
jgi:DNA-binding CsgD family transcriptional regulator